MSESLFTASGPTGSLNITGASSAVNTLDVPTVNTAIANNTVTKGNTTVFAGGSASATFTISGLPAGAFVQLTFKSQANAVGIKNYTATANTLTVNFTADPGTGTQLTYFY